MQNQLNDIRGDIRSTQKILLDIKGPVTQLRDPILSIRDPLIAIEKPITGVDKDLGEVKTLLGLVLGAVFASAMIIAIGTPVAAIIVWRKRHSLLPPPTAKEAHDEEKVKQAARAVDQQIKT